MTGSSGGEKFAAFSKTLKWLALPVLGEHTN